MKIKTILLVFLFSINSFSLAHQSSFYDSFFNDDFWVYFDDDFEKSNNIVSDYYFDENNDNYVLKIKFNKIDKDSINISVKDNILSISNEIEEQTQSDEINSYSKQSFSYHLTLPKDADDNSIKARFNENELIITIARSKTNNSLPRTIPITN